MIDELTKTELELLNEVSNVSDFSKGAYNIRKNGKLFKKENCEGVEITSKTDKPGININVSDDVTAHAINIPVIITDAGLNDLVYNDFYIGENCDVVINAGCAIHNDEGCETEHSGVHRFYIGKNSTVKYIEKHYGCGVGDGDRILNPVTEAFLEENSVLNIETTQISGVTKAVRTTSAKLLENSKITVRENIVTDFYQEAKTIFNVSLNGENSSCHLVSRAVAKDHSYQEFVSILEGNEKCYAHSECDAILTGSAKVVAEPRVIANNVEAKLVHEATIGKIAGEQLIKLQSLGLSENEATNVIINGFLS